jgi:hypothetical protein
VVPDPETVQMYLVSIVAIELESDRLCFWSHPDRDGYLDRRGKLGMLEQMSDPDTAFLEVSFDRKRTIALLFAVEDCVEPTERDIALIYTHLNWSLEQALFAGEGYLDLLVTKPGKAARIAAALSSYLRRENLHRGD